MNYEKSVLFKYAIKLRQKEFAYLSTTEQASQ